MLNTGKMENKYIKMTATPREEFSKYDTKHIVMMSHLSDAQMEMSMGDKQRRLAGVRLNFVKFLIKYSDSQVMEHGKNKDGTPRMVETINAKEAWDEFLEKFPYQRDMMSID